MSTAGNDFGDKSSHYSLPPSFSEYESEKNGSGQQFDEVMRPAQPEMEGHDGIAAANPTSSQPEIIPIVQKLLEAELKRLEPDGYLAITTKKREVYVKPKFHSARHDGTGQFDGVTLDLSRKNIGDLPEEVVDIVKNHVERLALSHNGLVTLTKRISECILLRYLNIRANAIKDFPLAICDITSLEILDISRNKLVDLPSEISRLTSLKVLSAAQNCLKQLPPSLGSMDSLKILRLENNPLLPPFSKWQEPRPKNSIDEVSATHEIKELLKRYQEPLPNKFLEADPNLSPTLPNAGMVPEVSQLEYRDDFNDDTGSIGSRPESSVFDRGAESRTTYPTTTGSSIPTPEDKLEQMRLISHLPLSFKPEIECDKAASRAVSEKTDLEKYLSAEFGLHNSFRALEFDAETSYSRESKLDDDLKVTYLQAFVNQLFGDITHSGKSSNSSPKIEPVYLDRMLKMFAMKLHGESYNPFQWGASVTLHRQRKEIMDMLYSAFNDYESVTLGDFDDEEGSGRQPFKKSDQLTFDWLANVEEFPDDDPWTEGLNDGLDNDDSALFQFSEYEQFVRNSEAYKWLIAKVKQHGRLKGGAPDFMTKVGAVVWNALLGQEPLRKLSRKSPPATVKMAFHLDWNPANILQGIETQTDISGIFDKFICLTGTLGEGQATTVTEYMAQTWPETWEPVIGLLQELVSVPIGEECSYAFETRGAQRSETFSTRRSNTRSLSAKITGMHSTSVFVTGGSQFVSETAEQLGWLGSALRLPPESYKAGIVTCRPVVENIHINDNDRTGHDINISGYCRMGFNIDGVYPQYPKEDAEGCCWAPLFPGSIIVSDYPILNRPQSNTGLELSLGVMASIVHSQSVIKWNERILMKGFSTLAVVTLATTGVFVWHVLMSSMPEERISHIEPELDKLDIQTPENISLRSLEGGRHIIGWCTDANEICGNETANLNVKSSGLKTPPSSIVIDRLYIEAGSEIVGGLNVAFNVKEKPFWLEREKDYPSLLKWISLQPVAFYDVSDRRAWLIDGASALLHLVRVSLYLDENDPESTYDWVFDQSKFKASSNGKFGRLAAMQTLKSWDVLNLELYITSKRVRNGQSETEYCTLEKRVTQILHSLEIMIDRQVKVAYQDGIKIPQSTEALRSIVGFDILDIVKPFGPVQPRIQQLKPWGHGWRDLVPAIGIMTIFGNGFGDLIQSSDGADVCRMWRSVPTGLDLMAASMSTLQMLHESRSTRMWPNLGLGEITDKIMWLSPSQPAACCQCIPGISQAQESCHRFSPVQYLLAKKTRGLWSLSTPMTPVDFAKIESKGAVLFGHLSLLKVGKHDKPADHLKYQGDQLRSVTTSNSSDGSVQNTPSISTAGSTTGSSLIQETTITTPSTETSATVYDDDDGQGSLSVAEENPGRGKKGGRWRDWTKRSKIMKNVFQH